MSLKQGLKKGDWIRATHDSGAVIEGQANHDLGRIGYAALSIRMPMNQFIDINVNFWDVSVTKENLFADD